MLGQDQPLARRDFQPQCGTAIHSIGPLGPEIKKKEATGKVFEHLASRQPTGIPPVSQPRLPRCDHSRVSLSQIDLIRGSHDTTHNSLDRRQTPLG